MSDHLAKSRNPAAGIPSGILKERKEKSKVLRGILDDVEVSRGALARALRVRTTVIEAWAEGFDVVPNTTFLVLEQAFDRWKELMKLEEDWPDFCEMVTLYAKHARLFGFRD